jgi:hypothetical protein
MGNGVSVFISNNCHGIDLINRRYIVFKGEKTTHNLEPILPEYAKHISIESPKVPFGCTEAFILYELAKHDDHQVPLIQGWRAFMAIGVSISPHQVNKRKAAVNLISIKSKEFEEYEGELNDLYENVLRHVMHTRGQNSQWNIGELGLNLEVDLWSTSRIGHSFVPP